MKNDNNNKKSERIILTAGNFEQEVLLSPKPVIMVIKGEWCGVSHIMSPVIEKLFHEYNDRLKFCELNIDKANGIIDRYVKYKLPSILFFKNGRHLDTITGIVSRKILEVRIKEFI